MHQPKSAGQVPAVLLSLLETTALKMRSNQIFAFEGTAAVASAVRESGCVENTGGR